MMAAELERLRAELAEERAERRRLSETLRVMAEAQVRREAALAEQKAIRKARNDRYRSSETSHETHHETSQDVAPPPPLDGSPPPSRIPPSPTPLSSPPPFPAPEGSPGERLQAALDLPGAEPLPKPGKPPKPPKAPKPPPEPKGDSRHKPLVAELVAVFLAKTGKAYGFLPVDARKVKDLLTLADQDPETRGERAPPEIARRWGIGLDTVWPNGQTPVQSLTALVQRWNECRELRTAAGTQRFVSASTANHPKEAGDVPF